MKTAGGENFIVNNYQKKKLSSSGLFSKIKMFGSVQGKFMAQFRKALSDRPRIK
jgi:hypothetical protein